MILASGKVASAVGASGSVREAGAASPAGGAASAAATAVAGSSPSQERSVDFLQEYSSWLSTKYDYRTQCTTREGSILTGSTGQP
jgi:hypothetical protein